MGRSQNQGRTLWDIDYVIQELFSVKLMEARKRPLHVYLRCITYNEVRRNLLVIGKKKRANRNIGNSSAHY